jgi:hypothetical protein
MITPHRSQVTGLGGNLRGCATRGSWPWGPKIKIASLWRWTAALMAITAVLAASTILQYQLGRHYGSLRIEPVSAGFLIADPSRM